MNIILQKIGIVIMSVLTSLGLMGGGVANKQEVSQIIQTIQQPTFGGTQPIAGGTYTLAGSGISSSATSITLNSLTIPQTGQKILDADLGDTFYLTLEPGNTTKQEIVSCTTVVQNANNTATLSGCERGLSPISPYTASSTLRFVHSGGSQVIFSDPPQLFQKYYALDTNSTSTGILVFSSTTPPRLDSVGAQASGNPIATTSEFATIAYVQASGAGTQVNATESTRGEVELATQIEMASSTAAGGTGASLVLKSQYATSSPYTTGLYIPITRNDGKLDPNFIATTSSDVYNFGGQVNLNASTTLTSTTTIAASSSNKLSLNTVPYSFPSSQGSASSFLQNNGSGGLSWGSISVGRYTYATTSVATTTSASCSGCGTTITSFASTTPTNITIPAGVLSASSTISVKANGICTAGTMAGSGSGSCSLLLRTTTGQTIWEGGVSGTLLGNYALSVDTLSNNSTSNQITIGTCSKHTLYLTASVTDTECSPIGNTSSIDFTQSLSLVMVIKATATGSGGNTGTVSNAGITNYSIVVNP